MARFGTGRVWMVLLSQFDNTLQSTVVFPMALPKSTKELNVSSLVCGPRTTSSNFITGTGLKKCKPPNLSCLLVALAMSRIVKDEVLEVKITCLKMS